MVYCDSIVENDSLFLENLATNASSGWSSESSNYAIYSFNYSKKLIKDHIYYARCKYKFTTTNQSPTWCKIYMQGGMTAFTASINNPKANTEYTISGYGIMTSGSGHSLTTGQVYNGNNNAINGVKAQIKELVIYDVTNLKMALLASGQISNSNDELVTWCNNNLVYKGSGIAYNVTSLITDSTKININKGIIHCSPVECDGMEVYSASTDLRNNTYFDEDSGVGVYNNKGNGTVTHERISAKTENSPFYPEHKYILKIRTNGEATPSCGGFIAQHTAQANKVFIERFVAKIPVGYNITAAYNSQGTGNSVIYLTPRAGTGDWKEYAILYRCGTTGTFSTGGHVYLLPDTGYSATNVTWYLAYVNNCDITHDDTLAYYTALNDKDIIKGTKIYSKSFNTVNLLPNGDGSDRSATLPTGWSWDTNDIAGNAKASIVQPKNAGAGTIGGKIKVNPHCKYKVSMWIKGKNDMTSFLVAIHPYVNDKLLTSPQVVYKPGTKTTLTADLVSGATQMTVASNANWADVSYARAGFRTSQWVGSYNDLGESHSPVAAGSISGVSGSNIVKFKSAYTGSTKKSGTVVVESRSGGWYPYPISKSNLPSDNTWKYVEGYFGQEGISWDGYSEYSSWDAIPSDVTHITLALNIYTNDSSEAIKYADIKIEELGTLDGERHLDTVQFKKFN
jgi:hypothetical protein